MATLTADIDGVHYAVPSYSGGTTTRPFVETYNYLTIKVDNNRRLTVNIGQYGPFKPGDNVVVQGNGTVTVNGQPQ